MRSLKNGRNTSVSIENITPNGIWVYAKAKEYFLPYDSFPFFKEQTIATIQNVQLKHEFHLFWPDLDVDLEIDNLENPAKYPLTYK